MGRSKLMTLYAQSVQDLVNRANSLGSETLNVIAVLRLDEQYVMIYTL